LEIKVMAVPIIPRLARGRLYFLIAEAIFLAFAQAVATWMAAEARQPGIAEPIGESSTCSVRVLVNGGVAWTS
jgi:hypothetical protein